MFPNEREFWVVHQQLGGDFTGDAGGILLFSFVIAWCITWRARLLVLCILKPCRFGRTCFPCRLLIPVWLKGRFALCDRARGKPNSAAELWECWHRESFLLEVWDDCTCAGRAESVHRLADAAWNRKKWSTAAGEAQLSSLLQHQSLETPPVLPLALLEPVVLFPYHPLAVLFTV